MTFNPNAAATSDSGIFGLPFTENESSLILVPVPWEATTSYGGGTSEGPSAILEASKQVDLFDLEVVKPYEPGIFMRDESIEVRTWNETAKVQAQKIIECGGEIGTDSALIAALSQVNEYGSKLNQYVYEQTLSILKSGKIPGIVGGDHSVPFGAFKAIAEKHPGFGILHFDAHSDTREAYEGFLWSHASIMRNALDQIPGIEKLVQVGIRDICEEEMGYTLGQKGRMCVFPDQENQRRKLEGIPWSVIAREVVAQLPHEVWISFDIDGLDPRYCPHTGTPVPGGLEFSEANYILAALVRSGRKIIGFDLNEVAPDLENTQNEWDANVGSRLLYKLCAWTFASQSKTKLR